MSLPAFLSLLDSLLSSLVVINVCVYSFHGLVVCFWSGACPWNGGFTWLEYLRFNYMWLVDCFSFIGASLPRHDVSQLSPNSLLLSMELHYLVMMCRSCLQILCCYYREDAFTIIGLWGIKTSLCLIYGIEFTHGSYVG